MRPEKQAVFKDYYTECEMLWKDCANKTVVSLLGLGGGGGGRIFNAQEALEG